MQYIITRKNEYSRKLKEFERQKRIEENEEADNNALTEQKKLQRFINTEQNITSDAGTSKSLLQAMSYP